jgi:hypothetical protein
MTSDVTTGAAACVLTCVGAAEEAVVIADVFAVSSAALLDFVVLLERVATGATVATRVLALAELVVVLVTVVLATTTVAALLTLVTALATAIPLGAGVDGLAPDDDCALGIDQMGPNTTATTTNVDSPAWSHVRFAPLVDKNRCPAFMPISPLPTRTDAGVSCAAFGHDLNG